MENRKISIKTIIILIMVVIIIALVMMNLNNKNNNIEQQLIQKEQLGEITEDSSYVKMQTHLSEVKEEEQKLISFKSAIASAITDMGIKTEVNADANTMANNIRNISTSNDLELPYQILPFSGMKITIDNFTPSNTIKPYDLTNVSSITFNVTTPYETLRTVGVGISGNPISTRDEMKKLDIYSEVSVNKNASKDIVLDVSEVKGKYYLCLLFMFETQVDHYNAYCNSIILN